MHDVVLYSRLQFGLTIIFHYLFPQLTMSLTALVAFFRLCRWRTKDPKDAAVTMFWTRILAITFVFGVVTGIPMEFQFGTNWASFSRFSGGVIGQTLAMEGVFAFTLESTFLAIMLAGPERVGRRLHLIASLLVVFSSWLSAYFILATNAWMQHPVGYVVQPDGRLTVNDFPALLGNPWLLWQFLHNQCASMVTGSFVVAATGAFYLLSRTHEDFGRRFLQVGVVSAAIFSALMIYPTGDGASRGVFQDQGTKAAAMEGLFHSEKGAAIALIGQPDMDRLQLDNPIFIPKVLSFLTYRRFGAEVKGLTAFPRDEWPDNVPLVYYAYHIMVGLGSIFVGVTALALTLLWRGRLFQARWLLWILMLAAPFPYIATTAGWVTAEVGRQPWIVWGLMRTNDGGSPPLNTGNAMFTLLGFFAMYLMLGVIYCFVMFRIMVNGPSRQKEE